MKTILTGTAAAIMGASPLFAGGLERAPQSIAILFEEGNYAELSFGGVNPTAKGHDLPYGAHPGNTPLGDIATGYGAFGLAYKHQINENLSAAVIFEQPFGADISYRSAAAGGSPLLGGTYTKVDTQTITGLLRYKFENNFSVHGGIRAARGKGEIGLTGGAYLGPRGTTLLDGYKVTFKNAWGISYLLGAAYEIPAYAARVSLTYSSSLEYDFDTVENTPLFGTVTSSTEIKAPQSLTLEGQAGINPQTLLFGSVRWVKWSEFKVQPEAIVNMYGKQPGLGFLKDGLVTLDDSTTFMIGIGRKLSENWSGVASFAYERQTSDEVSPLAPSSGYKSISLAAIYEKDAIKVTTGISYIDLNEARIQTAKGPGVPPTTPAKGQLTDTHAWAAGIKIGYRF